MWPWRWDNSRSHDNVAFQIYISYLNYGSQWVFFCYGLKNDTLIVVEIFHIKTFSSGVHLLRMYIKPVCLVF